MAAKLVTALKELASRIRDFEAIAAPNDYVLEESLGLFWLKPINPAIEKVWKYWRELWGQLPVETEIANWETARAEDCDFRNIAGARVRGLEMVRTLLLGMLNCYPSPEDDVLFPPVIAGTVAGTWVGWPWGHLHNGGKSPDDDDLPALPHLNASLAQIETAIGLLRSGELELATDRNGSPYSKEEFERVLKVAGSDPQVRATQKKLRKTFGMGLNNQKLTAIIRDIRAAGKNCPDSPTSSKRP